MGSGVLHFGKIKLEEEVEDKEDGCVEGVFEGR